MKSRKLYLGRIYFNCVLNSLWAIVRYGVCKKRTARSTLEITINFATTLTHNYVIYESIVVCFCKKVCSSSIQRERSACGFFSIDASYTQRFNFIVNYNRDKSQPNRFTGDRKLLVKMRQKWELKDNPFITQEPISLNCFRLLVIRHVFGIIDFTFWLM